MKRPSWTSSLSIDKLKGLLKRPCWKSWLRIDKLKGLLKRPSGKPSLRVDKLKGLLKWPFGPSTTPIGIDVGKRQIKAVQFDHSPTGWRIESAAAIPREADDDGVSPEEIARLRTLLQERAFKGNRVVLAVPPEKLLTGIMELPPCDSGAPIEALARSELARMHKCEPQSLEMAGWQLPAPARAANSSFVMGVGCRHDDANGLMDLFENEGFDVQRLETQAQALARACGPLLADTGGIAGILDLGWTAGRLVMLFQGVVVYERHLAKSGLGSLVTALAKQLDLGAKAAEEVLAESDVSAFLELGDEATGNARVVATAVDSYLRATVDEMRIPLSYLTNQYPDAPMQRLLLVGGGAMLGGLADHLTSLLNFEVRTVLPSDLGRCGQAVDGEFGPTLATAVGLGRPEQG